MKLNEQQQKFCSGYNFDISNLSALFLNGTLKPSGTFSHTEELMKVSQAIMEKNGVQTEILRVVDYEIPPGVYPEYDRTWFCKRRLARHFCFRSRWAVRLAVGG